MKRVIHGNLLIRAAICGFILAILFSFTGFSAQCDLLERSVLRLHIPANSDSEKDQAVKLQVRDAVLDEAVMWYGDTKNFDEALALVCTHINSLEEAANRVLRNENMPYRATAEICDAYFPTRVYETGALPAGKYRTVRISLGKAEGKNWWCVLFPSICVSGASEIDAIPKGARDVVEQEGKMTVKFKAAEILTFLRERFDV